MFWARIIALLLLSTIGAFAQSSPGFIDGAPLCANYPNPVCQGVAGPQNPLSLNQAFINKADSVSVSVTPQKFGALANSNGTHNNGNDDTAAVQAAVATGNAYFPCGVYRLTSTVSGNAANGVYHLRGEGQCSKIYLDATTAVSAFSFGPPSLCAAALLPCIIVEGLNFIPPNFVAPGNRAINVANSQRVTIRNNYISNYQDAVFLVTSYGPIITNNNFYGFASTGIFTPDASMNIGLIGWNTFIASPMGTAVFINGTSNGGLLIIGNDCESNNACFYFGGNSSGGQIVSNYIEFNTQFDIFWSGTQTGWRVANNRISSGLTTAWAISNSQIENNVFGGGTGTISVTGSNNFVSNNSVEAGTTFSAPNTIPAPANNNVLYWSGTQMTNMPACSNCLLAASGGGGPGFSAGPILGVNGLYGGSVTLNGATSGQSSYGVNATGAPQVTGMPTSAGGGGLAVCIDTAGVLYKKATCP